MRISGTDSTTAAASYVGQDSTYCVEAKTRSFAHSTTSTPAITKGNLTDHPRTNQGGENDGSEDLNMEENHSNRTNSRNAEYKEQSEPLEIDSTSTSKSTRYDLDEDDVSERASGKDMTLSGNKNARCVWKNDSAADNASASPLEEPCSTREFSNGACAETPANGVASAFSSTVEGVQNAGHEMLKDAAYSIIEAIGEAPERDGLKKTPERFAKSMAVLTSGYRQSAEDIIKSALFDVDSDDLVTVGDIDFHSLCEHHMLPFYGKVHIGYIPQGKVVGLSKLARVVNVFAKRLQVQERMTQEIADAIYHHTNALGVAVFVSASHMCMSMRGVEQPGSQTSTTCFRGCFKGHSEMARAHREDFFNHMRHTR